MSAVTAQKEIVLAELGETIILRGPASASELGRLSMHPSLSNFRPPQRQHRALMDIAEMPGGMVYAARRDNEILGYVTFHLPDGCSAYAALPCVLELGGIEVAREWRRHRLGSGLLKMIFKDPWWENYIVITTEYYRHWDLYGNEMDVWQYRALLNRLFGKVDFVAKDTNDPDILEHPANVLMARTGGQVALDDTLQFEYLCTGLIG